MRTSVADPEESTEIETPPVPVGYDISKLAELLPPPLCEDALALEFSRQHGRDWRYVADWGEWLGWDGKLWAKERTLQVHNLARKVCREVDARNAKADGTTRGGHQRRAAPVRRHRHRPRPERCPGS